MSLIESQNKKIITKDISLTIVRKEKTLSISEQAAKEGYKPNKTPAELNQPFLTEEIKKQYLKENENKTVNKWKAEPIFEFIFP